jgi:RNA recognition motif-containing protein
MGTRLFVGNLSFETTQSSLTEAFAKDGRKVVSVDIMADRATGRSRGFAFVEMASTGDAAAAITALDGSSVNGRPLRVSEAQERRSRPTEGGGFHRSER